MTFRPSPPGLAVLALITLSAALLAAGQQSDLPPIDPPDQWHLMTQNPATTTSKCVGSTRTAICALDTLLACIVDPNHSERCLAAASDKHAYLWYFRGSAQASNEPGAMKYRVIRAERVGAEPQPYVSPDPDKVPRPDDLLVRIRTMECLQGDLQRCVFVYYSYFNFYFRETSAGWRAINYDTGPVEPEH